MLEAEEHLYVFSACRQASFHSDPFFVPAEMPTAVGELGGWLLQHARRWLLPTWQALPAAQSMSELLKAQSLGLVRCAQVSLAELFAALGSAGCSDNAFFRACTRPVGLLGPTEVSPVLLLEEWRQRLEMPGPQGGAQLLRCTAASKRTYVDLEKAYDPLEDINTQALCEAIQCIM